MEWTDRLKEDEAEMVQPVARQNFSRLRKFYENMLGRSNPDEISSAADLVNCWFIAGIDMDRLGAIYDGSISAGREGFVSRIESVLGPYESILPRGVRDAIQKEKFQIEF